MPSHAGKKARFGVKLFPVDKGFAFVYSLNPRLFAELKHLKRGIPTWGDIMKSIWDGGGICRFPKLRGDIKADVLIIGGGMAGLLTGYFLQKAGVDCVIAEADRVCSGVTKNTTAKITAQHGLIYQKLVSSMGRERAALYYQANTAAVEDYAALCANIDCDFQRKDAYTYSLDDPRTLERELRALEAIGAAADFVEKLPLPMETAGAVCFRNQAQFEPLKFAAGISRELRIYEMTRVTEIRDGRALTDGGSVRAASFVVATHFPFMNKYGGYFLKLYQQRAYVLALKDAQDVGGMYIDEKQGGLSFRNQGELLLLGGNSHRTGSGKGGWKPLESFAAARYPGASEVSRWAAQDCMSLDGMPYIGLYSRSKPNIYVATGFNKWGMTGSMVAARCLTQQLTGKGPAYGELFYPGRSMLHPQLAINAAGALLNLLTPTAPRCPHMGCALKWNRQEQSWDCPCHGSRFTGEGKLIDNPATGDMKR